LIIGIISVVLVFALGIALALGIGLAIAYASVTGAYATEMAFLVGVVALLTALLPFYLGWVYLSQSGHILISKQAFYGERTRLPLKEAFKTFFRVLSAAFAQIICFVPLVLLLAGALYLLYMRNVSLWEIRLFWWVLPAFALAFVAVSNLFALTVPVAVFERRWFFAAIWRSWRLIKGEFWKILGIRVLWMLLVFLFSYSMQGVLMVIISIITVTTESALGDFVQMAALGASINLNMTIAVSVLVGPMDGILTALLYFNQKIKKEGLDIEIGLARLDAAL
jgi:hypothetical protein